MSPVNDAVASKEFRFKEYESLRTEVEQLTAEARALERNVLLATGAVWVWLAANIGAARSARWAWAIPVLFSVLGALRALAITNHFESLHEYLLHVERWFASEGGPAGWEHSLVGRNRYVNVTAFFYWLALIFATVIGAAYGLRM